MDDTTLGIQRKMYKLLIARKKNYLKGDFDCVKNLNECSKLKKKYCEKTIKWANFPFDRLIQLYIKKNLLERHIIARSNEALLNLIDVLTDILLYEILYKVYVEDMPLQESIWIGNIKDYSLRKIS